MFIRVKDSKNSPRQSVQIVENIRDGAKVKQKIVHHVGIAFDDAEEQKLRKMGEDLIAKILLQRAQESKQMNVFELSEEDFHPQNQPKNQPKNQLQNQPQNQLQLKKLGRIKSKEISDILPPNQVNLDDIIEEKRITEGVFEVCGQLFDDMHFDEILPRKQDTQMLKSVVLARMFEHHSVTHP